MNISFTFKNFDPSDHLKKYAQRRFEKLAKFVEAKSENSDLQVTLIVEKFRHRAEVVLKGDNLHITANEQSDDMYASIDMVLDKLEAQARKMREKSKALRKRQAAKGKSVRMDVISFAPEGSGGGRPDIVSTDNFEPKPMGVQEAAEQLQSLEYEFLVFRNSDTNQVNVIYCRKNGDFGLIAPGI